MEKMNETRGPERILYLNQISIGPTFKLGSEAQCSTYVSQFMVIVISLCYQSTYNSILPSFLPVHEFWTQLKNSDFIYTYTKCTVIQQQIIKDVDADDEAYSPPTE